MLSKLELGPDVVKVYDDFQLDPSIPIQQQDQYLLKEDLIQIQYINNFMLDVGWYPEFDYHGAFTTLVVKDYDWENPLLQMKCTTMAELNHNIKAGIQFIHNPFFQDQNQERLRRAAKDMDAGKWTVHDLIETEND